MKAALAFALGALVVAAAASGAAPGSRIVFSATLAPRYDGEVYRVRAGHAPIDLSRSPARDLAPALSTSGRTVAFLSGRGGRAAVYTVSTQGTQLRRISPYLFPVSTNDGLLGSLAWSRDDRALAAVVNGSPPNDPMLYLWRGGSWRALSRRSDLASAPQWSVDGRLVYVAQKTGDVRVLDGNGKPLWSVAGIKASWSSLGRLAVQENSYTVSVYDRHGKRVSRSVEAAGFAWSQDGRLATLSDTGRLRIDGRLVGALPKAGRSGVVQWLSPTQLRVSGDFGWTGFDLTRRRIYRLPAAYRSFFSVPYVDGSKAVAAIGGTLYLGTASGRTQVLTKAPPCDGAAFDSLQFLPGGSSVLYAAACPLPPADVYSVAPDGSSLRRLTATRADETEVAVSPDGSTLAFVRGAVSGHGSPHELLIGGRRLATDENNPYDDNPTFSPDGKTVLFTRSGPADLRLFTVPTQGGEPTPFPGSGVHPAWGPTRIAYLASSSEKLVTAAPDGTDVQQTGTTGIPAWSPAGRLAALRIAGRTLSIVLPATGRHIALPGLAPTFPTPGLAWSPDGTRLAFVAADRDGSGDVYTVGADGTGLRRVTHGLGAVSSLSWR